MNISIAFGFSAITFAGEMTPGNVEKGRNLCQASHVYNVVERAGVITSKVIRQTSVNLPPYDVTITIDSNRSVVTAVCSCIAGIVGHCKHILATVIFINEDNSSTKTSGPCEWKQPSLGKTTKAKAKYSKGQRWEDIFGVREKSKVYTPIQINRNMVTFETPSMLQYMLQDPIQTKNNEEDLSVKLRIISNIQIAPPIYCSGYDFLKKLFLMQKSSRLLKELYEEEIKLVSYCCIKTYNENFPCEALDICLETKVNKELRATQRKFRITASRAYSLYTYKGGDWLDKSKKYFQPRPFSNKYTQHGIVWEPVARKQYSIKENCQVLETGLIVCQTDPWLAVSPDGVVFKNNQPTKLLEIKCPFIGKDVTAEVIEDHCDYLKRDKGKLVLKRKHGYYTQVQLNMALLNLTHCDFIVFCSLDQTYKIVDVPFNESFAKDILFKLKHA